MGSPTSVVSVDSPTSVAPDGEEETGNTGTTEATGLEPAVNLPEEAEVAKVVSPLTHPSSPSGKDVPRQIAGSVPVDLESTDDEPQASVAAASSAVPQISASPEELLKREELVKQFRVFYDLDDSKMTQMFWT